MPPHAAWNEWRAHTQGSSAETRGSSVKQLRCAVCTRQVQRRGGVLAKVKVSGPTFAAWRGRKRWNSRGRNGPSDGANHRRTQKAIYRRTVVVVSSIRVLIVRRSTVGQIIPAHRCPLLQQMDPCTTDPPLLTCARLCAAAEAPRKPSHMPLKSSYSGFFTRRMNVSVDVNASEDRGPPPCARLLSSAACSLARAGAAQ